MLKRVRLYFKLINICIRSQMQHRASFIMLLIAYFFSTMVDLLGIWVLFDRFKMIKGWTLPEIALIYGVMHMGFSLSEVAARGFDTVGEIIKSGEFDRILLRPCGTILQVATRQFQLLRLGRFFQGLLVLIWACMQLQIAFISWNTSVLILSILGIATLFYGLNVLQGTLSFWSTETLELMNITTYGGLESGQYPMSIYPLGFRYFFTFFIPLALVSYYPIAILAQHESYPLWVACLAPFCGLIFLYFTCKIWHFGVRHYHSTGS